MAVLGLITCEVLELEFARLLGTDCELERITVLADRRSARLLEHLTDRPDCPVMRVPHVHAFHPEPALGLEVLVRVLGLGLHRDRKVLRTAVAHAVRELRPVVDALLLGYGRCGSALDDLPALVDVDVPVFQPMDQGCPVDDCVGLCLGSRDAYRAEQQRTPGTFFLTPGWSTHWKGMLDPRSGALEQPGLHRLLSGYERVLLVQTPALPAAELRHRGAEFSQATGLRVEERAGSMALLEDAWAAARTAVRPKAGVGEGNGSWPPGR